MKATAYTVGCYQEKGSVNSVSELANKILLAAMQPDERGRQRLIGASQVGGCQYCLGLALMQEKKEDSLPKWIAASGEPNTEGLAAWIGTAVHYYLEKVIIPQVMEEEGWDTTKIVPEEKVPIYDLKDYGLIQGNIDVHDDIEIVDWKVVGDFSWNKMLMEAVEYPDRIPRKQYRVQQMLYAYGLRLMGYHIEKVSLAVFKKMSNNWKDIEIYTEYYNQNVVDAALTNLEETYRLARQRRYDELQVDDDCYNCSRGF